MSGRLLIKFIFTTIVLSVINLYAFNIDSVITRSDSCVHIQWVPDSTNTDPFWYTTYGTTCINADSVYRHCDFLPGHTYNGIAYSYGGEDPWYLFRSRLSMGFLVGSHQCHYTNYGDPSNRITGTDCSGFLSFVWDHPRVATGTFYNSTTFKTVSFSEILPGDALVMATANCGNHALLVIEADTITEVVVSEASSTARGCRERVIDLTETGWSCYKAIRYPKLTISESATDRKSAEKPFKKSFITSQKHINGDILLQLSSKFEGTAAAFTLEGKLIFPQRYISGDMITLQQKIPPLFILVLTSANGNSYNGIISIIR